MPTDTLSPFALYAATFLYALLGGVVPLLNVEAYMLSLSVLSPQAATLPAAVAAASGQMVAKVFVYLTARRLANRRAGFGAAAAARLGRTEGRATAVLVLSAVTGLPPFYGVSLGAGLIRYPLVRFVVLGAAGRLVHFVAIFVVPRLASS